MTLPRLGKASSYPSSAHSADAITEPVEPTKLPKPLDVRIPNRVEQAGPFPWPERFFNRRKLPSDWENTPWLYATLRDMEQDLKCPEEEDILRSLRTEENWAPDQFRLDVFLDIIQGRTLQQLEEDGDGVPETKVALLIDSNNVGSKPEFRPLLGGLSARQLLREATKERYELDYEQSTVSSGFVEAERRLIYVVDLDSWSILALLGSSPESLYREVTECILNHLSAKSEIGVSFAVRQHKKLLDDFLLASRNLRAQQEAERKLNECEMMVKEAGDVLRDLKRTLGETLSSAAVFTETDVNYFLHQDGRVGDAIDCMMPLSQIRKTLNKMGRTHRDIGELQGTCESMLESGIRGRKKSMLTPNMNATNTLEKRMLLWITMMSQPLLNVAAIFSCDGIITFPRTWYNFLYALFFMVAAMGSIVVLLLKLLESGVSLFESRAGGQSSAEETSDCSRERGGTGPVDASNRLPPRRSTWCTSGMGHIQRRHAGDIGLLDLPGRSVLGQPATIGPSLNKPSTAVLARR
ncbi:uncharacterized protein BDZ83DRAFT_700424 [Colletotrichum acutatum]|uniref:Uncharacterized protein n=1 Tax=Glomerella acutata TaxID=27357 RepID=A0AAD8UNQ4_GLOAC|nr:uncharacterized protein BDZ83DRAFT_700424 [Colletotrichum acutatum]KAK1724434.1 hypothetical protein BDZ83DRAFT_700424 [Colletotrichum acutatum]